MKPCIIMASDIASNMALNVVHAQSGPLFRRIQQVMRERITQGSWAAGQPLPSRVQLCAEFATTRVTLDKAIHELVREGLLRSAKGSGTFVASEQSAGEQSAGEQSAPEPASPRILRLGVMMSQDAVPGETQEKSSREKSGTDNLYFGPLFQGIRDAVIGKPVETVYAYYSRSDYAAFYRENALDGVLLIAPLLQELPALRALATARILFVAAGISSDDPADGTLPFVDADNRQGAADAVAHLLALGHRRIALVNLATAQANHHDRLEGYRRALAAADMLADPHDLLLYPIHEQGRLEERIQAWLSHLLSSGSLPTAIFACDYFMAVATMRVLRRSGLRVPEDVSVVGFDDPFSAEHLTPALTAVRQPIYEIGRRAAQRLLDALAAGTTARGMEIFPTRLIVRDSACPPLVRVPLIPVPLSQSSSEKEGISL